MVTGRPKPALILTIDEHTQLRSLAGSRTLPHALVARARVVLWSANGQSNTQMVINDRILVADNTRSDTQDGEVIDQSSLLLTLSQKVTFDGIHSYTIYLQHPDSTVEAIAIVAGPDPNQVVLFSPPTLPCVMSLLPFRTQILP